MPMAEQAATTFETAPEPALSCYRQGVRESMARLPHWLQPLLTWLTGKPFPGQRPWFVPHPLLYVAFAPVAIVVTSALEIALLRNAPAWGLAILPIAWVINTGMFRQMHIVDLHHIAHGSVARSAWLTSVLIDSFSTFALIINGGEFRTSHLGHHRRRIFATIADDDVVFLDRLGFRPGIAKAVLWRRLAVTLASPAYHWMFLRFRLKSNLQNPALYRRALAWVWIFALVAFAVFSGWWEFLLVVVVPLIPLYQMSALIQTLTEHAWFARAAPLPLELYAQRCWGRFCGEPFPPEGLRQQILWWFRLLLLHLPVRIAIWTGDLPAHDWHHLGRYAGDDVSEWTDALYKRQRAIARGDIAGMATRELWGLRAALDHAFGQMVETEWPR